MTQIDFHRLDELFNQALTLPPEQWPSFVSKACGDDAPSAQRLLAMLQADHGADTEADPVGNVIANQRQQQQQPTHIGPYDVVRTLGHGGMGSVYLAERQQPGFVQQVAIKLLRGRTASESLRSRFRQEQQVLASLRHAAIAGLVDAGETDSGQPYVVMEYVEGQTLTDYAEQQQLDAKARIKLFVQLCGAASYAHRNLIVHRDLKPDNVLVDANGMVKLLDFGIAKLLPADGSEEQLGTFTRAGAMTPPYASPEQVRGQSISTQSDIYSLGVVLYELLAGQLPYVIDSNSSALELERQICDTEPVPPSKRTSERIGERADALVPARRLRGDLDNIVLKAMRKEPQRRYDSVAQLADDLQRYLDDLPVSARADSFVYRTQKLVARNPLAVAASALLVLSLAAFAVTTRWQASQIAVQRDLATQEAEAATQVADFMVGLFQVSDPRESAKEELTARDLLDRAVESVEQDIDAAPLQRARLMHTLGLAYTNLGEYSGGQRLLNSAMVIREQEFGADSLEVADSLNRIGNFHREYGRLDAAEQTLKEALRIRERAIEGANIDLADSYNNVGLFLRQIGKYDEAVAMLERAIAMHQELAGGDNRYVAYASHNLAQAKASLGQYADAERLLERALEIKRNEGLHNQATYANSTAELARVERLRGNFTSALKHREQSLALRRAIYLDAHPSLVSGLLGLAAVQVELSQLAAAQSLLDEALPLAESTAGPQSNLVARVRTELGILHLARSKHSEAITELEQALAIRQQVMRPDNPTVWYSQHMLGVVLLADQQLARAEPLLSSAHLLYVEKFPPNHPSVLASAVALAELHSAMGRQQRALELAKSVVARPLSEPSWVGQREIAKAHQLLARLSADQHDVAARHERLAAELLQQYSVALGAGVAAGAVSTPR